VEEAKKLVAKGDTGRAFPYAAFAALRGSEEGSALLSKIRSGRISNQDGLQANLDAACRHGDLASCFALALAKGNRGGPEATAYLSHACDKSDLPACRELGRVFDKGLWDVPQDEKRAVDLFRGACDGGELRGCAYLGVMYDNGISVAKDEKRALGLFQKACDGGEMRGCTYLGSEYANGISVAKDEKRAVDLFGKACDVGEMLGCGVGSHVVS
jgi:TPR repeat protein